MNKFTAIVLFVAGSIVLGSAAMASSTDKFLVSDPDVAEEINMDLDTLTVARPNPGTIDIDLMLIKGDLGLNRKPAKAKTVTCSRRELANGLVGEMVTTCE
jgi:hypothetical protein